MQRDLETGSDIENNTFWETPEINDIFGTFMNWILFIFPLNTENISFLSVMIYFDASALFFWIKYRK